MFEFAIIGLIGAIILALAWIPEIIEIIRIKESRLNPRFAVLAWIATLFLLIYSIGIRDIIFTAVNGFILFEVSISIYYEFFVEEHKKKKKQRKKRK